jgi:hypothetical protein
MVDIDYTPSGLGDEILSKEFVRWGDTTPNTANPT